MDRYFNMTNYFKNDVVFNIKNTLDYLSDSYIITIYEDKNNKQTIVDD